MKIEGWLTAAEAYQEVRAVSGMHHSTFWNWKNQGGLDDVETRMFGKRKMYNLISLRAWIDRTFSPIPTAQQEVGDDSNILVA